MLCLQQLRKRLKSLKLSPVKIKIIPHMRACYVTFRNEEDRQVGEATLLGYGVKQIFPVCSQAALTAINGHVWKKETLSAKVSVTTMSMKDTLSPRSFSHRPHRMLHQLWIPLQRERDEVRSLNRNIASIVYASISL